MNETVKEHKASLNLRGISEKLRHDFKVHCVRRGLTMTEVIVDFMERTVQSGSEEQRTVPAGA